MKRRFIINFACAVFLIAVTTAYAYQLPDTGQTKCYRDVSPYDEVPCAGTGQDGEYNINPMSFIDNGDGTVTDNNTGLMWQKCSVGQNNDATCSGTAETYNWYQASGAYDDTYNPSSIDVCGNLELGGYSDWRLPAKKELISIVDYSIPNPGSTINTTYFSNTISAGYWSSTTFASSPGSAWSVGFGNGNVFYYGKDGSLYYRYVRCVRGGQSSSSFTDNGNSTVTDNKTGLVWQQTGPGAMTWGSALSYCNELSLGGNIDWRLPNIKELESLTDDTRYNPAIDTTFFPGADSSNYWSSSTSANGPSLVWCVYFNFGYFNYGVGPGNFYVRCVRGGQSGGSFDYYCDDDSDGYIDSLIDGTCTGSGCVPVGCQTTQGNDCNDNNLLVNPGMTEVAGNCKDDDCNPATLISLLGEINKDDCVDISDVILVLRIALKIDPVQPCSDLNNDGVVDISDVILTLRMALKIDPLKQCP